MDDVFSGMQDAYAKLAADALSRYGETIKRVGAMGVDDENVKSCRL